MGLVNVNANTNIKADINYFNPYFNMLAPAFSSYYLPQYPNIFSQLNNKLNLFNFGSLKFGSVTQPTKYDSNLGNSIVTTALKYKGYNEKDGSYKKFTGGRSEAWCADFATYVTREALRANGKSIPKGFGSSSVAGLKSWGQKNGRYVTNVAQAKPGDIVIFNWSHTGIVKNILADGTVVTIEGNTSGKRGTSDRVMQKTRSLKDIKGFVQVA